MCIFIHFNRYKTIYKLIIYTATWSDIIIKKMTIQFENIYVFHVFQFLSKVNNSFTSRLEVLAKYFLKVHGINTRILTKYTLFDENLILKKKKPI